MFTSLSTFDADVAPFVVQQDAEYGPTVPMSDVVSLLATAGKIITTNAIGNPDPVVVADALASAGVLRVLMQEVIGAIEVANANLVPPSID